MKMLKTIWQQSGKSLIILLVILAVGMILVQAGGRRKPDLELTGVGFNAELSEQGVAWLKEELSPLMGTGNPEAVAFTMVDMASFSDPDAINENYYLMQNILDLCRSDSLDYFILDKTAMENLIPQNIFLDLRSFLTQEELQQWEAELIWAVEAPKDGAEPDMEARRPVVIKLTGVPFFTENSPNELYLAISSRTTHLTQCRTMWDHVMQWTPRSPWA